MDGTTSKDVAVGGRVESDELVNLHEGVGCTTGFEVTTPNADVRFDH